MPILPENRARYPRNWSTEIRPRILLRAGYCCEGSPDFPQCRAPNHALGYWRDGQFVPMPRSLREAGAVKGSEIACSDGTTIKIIQIVLTVAHLDHTPEHCEPENLKAWCQRCHLHYDRQHHAETRRKNLAAGDLFGLASAKRPSVEITPTIAMQRGYACVSQCDHCGAMLYAVSRQTLGPCPCCGDTRWTKRSMPVGPFHEVPANA